LVVVADNNFHFEPKILNLLLLTAPVELFLLPNDEPRGTRRRPGLCKYLIVSIESYASFAALGRRRVDIRGATDTYWLEGAKNPSATDT
jgi:hypothetical protein